MALKVRDIDSECGLLRIEQGKGASDRQVILWVLSWNYGSCRCGLSENHGIEQHWINQLVMKWKANAAKGDPDAIAVLSRLSEMRPSRKE